MQNALFLLPWQWYLTVVGAIYRQTPLNCLTLSHQQAGKAPKPRRYRNLIRISWKHYHSERAGVWQQGVTECQSGRHQVGEVRLNCLFTGCTAPSHLVDTFTVSPCNAGTLLATSLLPGVLVFSLPRPWDVDQAKLHNNIMWNKKNRLFALF